MSEWWPEAQANAGFSASTSALIKVGNRALAAERERDEARAALRGLRELVNQQAEDDGLWFAARYITEDYLQQELRKLHAAIEAACP